MKTIAQQLNIKEFPFIIKDSNGNEIYYEYSDGDWYKKEYDSNGNKIYYEDSAVFWCKYKYDSKGKSIYYENSKNFWSKKEYDSNGNEIYYEDSSGNIVDNRPKEIFEMTMEEICKALDKNIKIIK